MEMNINSNTGLSIGIVTAILGALAWIIGGQAGNARAISDMKNELSVQAIQSNNVLTGKIDKLETRMTALESGRNSWTHADMFRWAVHLQQANTQIKVPEPEASGK